MLKIAASGISVETKYGVVAFVEGAVGHSCLLYALETEELVDKAAEEALRWLRIAKIEADHEISLLQEQLSHRLAIRKHIDLHAPRAFLDRKTV